MANKSTVPIDDDLREAVARIASKDGKASDPLSVLLTLLPKLLENKDEREDVMDKLEGLQTGDLREVRKQLWLARKQLNQLYKAFHKLHEVVITLTTEVRNLREQQTATGEAVLQLGEGTAQLCEELGRIEIIEDVDDIDDVDEIEDDIDEIDDAENFRRELRPARANSATDSDAVRVTNQRSKKRKQSRKN